MSIAKQLHLDIPTTMIVFIKSCVGLMFFLPVIILNKEISIKTNQSSLYALKISLTVGSMLCTYYAYRNLPLTDN